MNDNEAARALEAFADAPAMAEDMSLAFEEAADRMANALERAAKRGELSFEAMAQSILTSLAQLAIEELIANPLEQVLQNGLQSLGASKSSQSSNLARTVVQGHKFL